LGGALRAYFGAAFFQFNFLFAPFLAIGLIWYLIKERPEILWGTSFAPILAASVYLAPFGWFFDQTVMLVMYLSALYWALLARHWPIIIGLLVLQVVSHLFINHVAQFQHEMFWYLPVMVVLWFIASKGQVASVKS